METPTTEPRGAGASPPPAIPQTLFTVAQLAAVEPALGAGAIRDDLFNRETNGLAASGAVVYRGRRILLHRERYLAWIAARSRRAAS